MLSRFANCAESCGLYCSAGVYRRRIPPISRNRAPRGSKDFPFTLFLYYLYFSTSIREDGSKWQAIRENFMLHLSPSLCLRRGGISSYVLRDIPEEFLEMVDVFNATESLAKCHTPGNGRSSFVEALRLPRGC